MLTYTKHFLNRRSCKQQRKFWTRIILFGCLSVAARSTFAQQKKNVLFIVVDDLRPALSCYGDALSLSPHIDRLAENGVVFNQAYCQQAVCAPSRASLMTGKKPDNTRVWNLTTHFRKALPDVVTLPQYFKNNGYYTRQIGKIYHDPKDAQDPPSWSVAELFAVTSKLGKYVLDSNLQKADKATAMEQADVPDSAYIDGMVADAATEELRNMGSKPFFLAVGFRRPHLPYSVPLSYWKKNAAKKIILSPDTALATGVPSYSLHNSVELRGYTDIPDFGPINDSLASELIKGYYTSISYVDNQIGKVLDELKRLNLDKNTIVILLGDHGFHLGEHGLWGKTTNSKIDTQVPLVISVPSKKKNPGYSDEVVQLVDLYATLSDLCNLPPPQTDGTSFANVLRGKPFSGKGVAFSQFPDDMKFDKQPKVMGYAIHSVHYGYTEWVELQTGKVLARELYDYDSDPGENVNVSESPKYQKQIKKFHDQIKSYRN
ncbi:sulfatase-like hydrolase/transferase [Pedobacter sp. HMF7647]|uniref:Sulfatase-like hydrolase/transferase n=1 Tax=Hufsiella arboris TaxID=2695275 RepID=A0A7K1YD02_9SPHI|nr:sulfatase [Hufsiella arboris]MXV51928.1 sulfatase-like hydrolase/transferase [Hufsiella arboris]